MNRRPTSNTWVLGLSLAIGAIGCAGSQTAHAQTATPITATAPADDETEITRLIDEGKPADALRLSERALAQARMTRGERDPRTIELLSLWAAVLDELGRFDEALQARELVLSQRTAVLGAEHPKTLEDMTNLATSLYYTGRVRDAAATLRTALATQTRVLGARAPLTLSTLSALASSLNAQAQWAEAQRLYEQAYRLQSEVLGPTNPNTLTSLANYAGALGSMGRAEEAEPLSLRVLQLRREVLGAQHPDTATALNNYAAVLERLGRYEASSQHFAEAADAAALQLGADHPAALKLRSNQANSLVRMGETGQALLRLRQVVAAFERSGQARHAFNLSARYLLGAALSADGQWAAAQVQFKQAWDGFVHQGGPLHTEAMLSQYGFAQTQAQLGDLGGAINTLREMTVLIDRQRRETAEMTANARRQWLRLYVGVYQSLAEHLRATGQMNAAFDLIEQSKASVLLAQMSEGDAAAQAGLSAAERQRLLALRQQVALASAAQAQAPDAGARAALQAQANSASMALSQFQAQLAASSPQYALLNRPTLAVAADAARLLAPDALFVSFVAAPGGRLRAVTLNAAGRVRWHDLGAVVGLDQMVEALRLLSASDGRLIGSGGEALHVLSWQDGDQRRWRLVSGDAVCSPAQMQVDQRLGRAPTSQAALGQFGQAVAEPNCAPPGAAQAAPQAAAEEIAAALAARLLAPLAADWQAGGQLVIAPDGPLWLLPWDALPWAGKPLALSFQTRQVHSLSVLQLVQQRLATRQVARPGQPGLPALLAFGDPSYAPDPASNSAGVGWQRSPLRAQQTPQEASQALATLSWPRLPFARLEMAQVSALFKHHGTRLISGDAATETTLRSLSASGELARYRYVLFSAHGYFDPERPEFSSLVLKPDGEGTEHDGFVSVDEWLPLRLNSDLVVLSACDTARGRAISGDGLLGLSYALFVAGNANTLATLWPVADRETALFVVRFFANLRRGLPQAQALATTKREFIRHANPRLRQPRHWAGFVLYGA